MTSKEAVKIIAAYKKAKPGWDELGEIFSEIGKKMHRVQYNNALMRNGGKAPWHFREETYVGHMIYEDGTAGVEMESYYCGEADINTYQFPLSRLDEPDEVWMPKYDAELTAMKDAAKIKKEKEQEEKQKAAIIEDKERRRQKWLELSKEFGS